MQQLRARVMLLQSHRHTILDANTAAFQASAVIEKPPMFTLAHHTLARLSDARE